MTRPKRTPLKPPRPGYTRLAPRDAMPVVTRLLTTVEVAEVLHVHPTTVKRVADRGDLPFFRVCKRGDRRYRVEDVRDYLEAMMAPK